MATVTHQIVTGSTANATSYTSGAFTPPGNSLLVVIVHASGSVAAAPTCAASANGITFTRVGTLIQTLSSNHSAVFIADQLLPASPVSMTVTFACTSDAATGAFIAVAGVGGMTKVGAAAVKQTGFAANIASSKAWTANFAAAPDTNNPIIGFIGHAGGAAVTPPTGFTEQAEPTDQSAPALGFEYCSASSDQTATSYTWTSSLGSPSGNTRANIGLIELDASGSSTVPSAPTSVSASAGNASATVNWTLGADGGSALTGHTVTSSPGGFTATVGGAATSANVSGLTNGVAYTFTVIATNAVGNSSSSAASNSVIPVTTPSAPTGVSASAGDASASVSWVLSADGGSALTGHTVTSSPGGLTATVSGSATSANVTGLTNGVPYTFTVVATNANGNSTASAPSNSVTPAAAGVIATGNFFPFL